MIVLGIDPGTAIVGWGVIDTGASHNIEKAVCLGYGVITTDKSMTDSIRLVAIATGLEEVLKQYTPDLVGVEKLFFSNNQKTVMTVSQARGVILLILEQQRISLLEFTPLQVKQALTGFGRAEKAQMQQMTKLLLKLPGIPKPDDAADALAIALTAAQTKVELL
jgi:crossover junction endodeoxyribonuclease RuvC